MNTNTYGKELAYVTIVIQSISALLALRVFFVRYVGDDYANGGIFYLLVLISSILAVITIFKYQYKASWFWWFLTINLIILNLTANPNIFCSVFVGYLFFKYPEFHSKVENTEGVS